MPRWRRILSHPLVPALLLAAAGVILLIVWSDEERAARQQKFLASVTYAGVAIIATFIWFVLLSRFSWRVRRGVGFGVLLLIGLFFATIDVEGVDGDLRPIWRFRWTKPPDQLIEPVKVVAKEKSGASNGKVDDSKDKISAEPPVTTEAPATSPHDFPQFLGANRDGMIRSVRLKTDWTAHPPRLLWKQRIGAAWSGFAVVGDRAITQEQRGEDELVVCYELTTGRPLWSHADKARYDTKIAGVGPRATPTIAGHRVYTMGGTGILSCLDLASGERLWAVDTLADHNANLLDWGMSGSPLVAGQKVIVPTAGSFAVAAYDRESGRRQWAAGPGPTSYSSPAIIELHGERQLVMQNQFTLTGHSLEDGRVLWSHDTPGGHPKVAQPLLLGNNRLLVSSGYGTGSDAFELTKSEAADGDGAAGGPRFTTRSLWKNLYIKAKFTNVVLHKGHIYGLNDGTLTCLKAETGERAWRGERYGHGQLLLVGDVLLIQAESGDVVLVKATPEEFSELTRFKVFDDKTWNSPTLAGKYLLVRNDREAACYEVAVE